MSRDIWTAKSITRWLEEMIAASEVGEVQRAARDITGLLVRSGLGRGIPTIQGANEGAKDQTGRTGQRRVLLFKSEWVPAVLAHVRYLGLGDWLEDEGWEEVRGVFYELRLRDPIIEDSGLEVGAGFEGASCICLPSGVVSCASGF
jgi:hypothetical protein